MRRAAAQSPGRCLQQLKSDTGQIAQFVEEILRLEAPVQGQFRIATTDTKLDDLPISKGTLLHVRMAAANRDAHIFGDKADVFSLGVRLPKPHLAFGAGMHFCLGAALARLELRIAFESIVHRFDHIALAMPENQVRHHRHFHLRGIRSLRLRIS